MAALGVALDQISTLGSAGLAGREVRMPPRRLARSVGTSRRARARRRRPARSALVSSTAPRSGATATTPGGAVVEGALELGVHALEALLGEVERGGVLVEPLEHRPQRGLSLGTRHPVRAQPGRGARAQLAAACSSAGSSAAQASARRCTPPSAGGSGTGPGPSRALRRPRSRARHPTRRRRVSVDAASSAKSRRAAWRDALRMLASSPPTRLRHPPRCGPPRVKLGGGFDRRARRRGRPRVPSHSRPNARMSSISGRGPGPSA